MRSDCREEIIASGSRLIPRSCPTCGIRVCMRRQEAIATDRNREAFEAFIQSQPHYREFADLDNVLARNRGQYLDPLTQGAWMAWEAGLTHA